MLVASDGELTKEIKMRYLLANLPIVIALILSIYICFRLVNIYKFISTKRKIQTLIRKYRPQQKEVLNGRELTELVKIIIEGEFYDSETMEHCVNIYIRKKTPQ